MIHGKHSLLIIFILCAVAPAVAQKVEKVEAHATYHAPSTMAPKEARYQAVVAAQVDAIAKTFGTIISEENMSFMREKNTESTSDFFNLQEGDVRGLWLETIGDTIWSNPLYKDDGSVIYEVSLKGKIMELKNAAIDMMVKLLFNGINPDRNEIRNNSFNDGDDMYLYFRTPIDGYLAVYIVDFDDNFTTQRLLPYPNQPGAIYKVTADTDYVFFSENKAEPDVKQYVRGCRMHGRSDHDWNQFYVIFSPNPFVKALDKSIDNDLPNVLTYDEFQRWLSRNIRKDLEMCAEKILVEIVKK